MSENTEMCVSGQRGQNSGSVPYNAGHTKQAVDSLPDSTIRLLERARAGDKTAVETLFARYLPRLRRWASGRLPRWARDIADTHDLVQETLLQTFKRVEAFEVRGEGAFQAYLRQAMLNRIRNELRRFGRRPEATNLDTQEPSDSPSPLEAAIGREAMERYDTALMTLTPEDRELVIAKLEMGYDYEELAAAFGRPSTDAARKAVQRATVRLVDAMRQQEAAAPVKPIPAAKEGPN